MKPETKKTKTRNIINKLILLKKFAQVEDLAHSIAYDNSMSDGDTINLLKWNGAEQTAKVTRIPIQNQSMVAHILEIESSNPKLPNEVKIIWRGTHDKGSAIADLDPISPGYQEYIKNRDIILQYVNAAISKMATEGKKVSLGSYGHSLGGSLAQVFAVDVMDAVVQNQQAQNQIIDDPEKSLSIPPEFRNHFDKIKEINIGTFNSAGVSKMTAARCKFLDAMLHNNTGVAKKDPVKIRYFAGLNSGDGVQQTGEASILADSTTAEVYLLKTKVSKGVFFKILTGAVSIGRALLLPKFRPSFHRFIDLLSNGVVGAIGTINAHTAKVFNKEHNLETGVIKFNLYENKKPKDRPYITQQLNNKSTILQNPILKSFQAKIYNFTDKLFNRHSKEDNKIVPKKPILYKKHFIKKTTKQNLTTQNEFTNPNRTPK